MVIVAIFRDNDGSTQKEIIMKMVRIGFLMVLAVFVAWMPTVGFAGDLNIAYEGVDGKPRSDLRAIISFNAGAQALGAFQLELQFDPEKIQIKGVQPGDNLYFPQLISKIDNVNGIVNLSAFQGSSMTEPTGNIILTKLQIEIKGVSLDKDLFVAEKIEILSPQGTRLALK